MSVHQLEMEMDLKGEIEEQGERKGKQGTRGEVE